MYLSVKLLTKATLVVVLIVTV